MKKAISILPLLLLYACLVQAQKALEIQFTNGERRTVIFEYDDPDVLTKWNIDIRPLGFSIFSREHAEGTPSMRLGGIYRITSKLSVQGLYLLPYSKDLDDNIWTEAKSSKDWSLFCNYEIASKSKTKLKKQSVDFGGSRNTEVVYKAKLPRVSKRSLAVTGGFSGYRYYNGGDLIASDVNSKDVYNLENVKQTCFNIGLSMNKTESYLMNTNEKKRSYWRYNRVFALLSLGLTSNYDVTKTAANSEKTSLKKGDSGFEAPGKKSIGYRIGAEKYIGIKNSGWALIVGLELDGLPGIDNSVAAKSNFMIHIGVLIGPKPDKL